MGIERLTSLIPHSLKDRLPWLASAGAGASTLLFVGAQRTVRLDADGGGKPFGAPEFFDVSCGSVDALVDTLTAVLQEGPALSNKVWVLCEHLTLSTVMLASAQVAGLEGATLDNVLRFELESVNAEPLGNRRLGWTLLNAEDGMNAYALCLAPNGLLEAVGAEVARHGGKLAGLGHPGGLPKPLSRDKDVWQLEHAGTVPRPTTAAGAAWQRLEHWPTVTVGVAGDGKGRRWLQTFKPLSEQRGAIREVERWRRSLPRPELVENFNLESGLEVDSVGTALFLDRPDDLSDWLSSWLVALSADEGSALPFLRPVAKPVPELVWSSSVALATVLLCAGHYVYFARQTANFEAQAADLRKVESEIKTLRESASKRESERSKLEQMAKLQRGNREAIPLVMNILRERYSHLLYELATHLGEQMVLEKISATREGVEIEGITLEPYEPTQLAATLNDHLARLGWSVQPPTREDIRQFPDGGPWRFAVKLTDKGLASIGAATGGNPS